MVSPTIGEPGNLRMVVCIWIGEALAGGSEKRAGKEGLSNGFVACLTEDFVTRNISSSPGVVLDCGVPGLRAAVPKGGDGHVEAGGRWMEQAEGL
jgi:hypothetical protein